MCNGADYGVARGRPPATGKAILSKPMQTGPTDEEGNPDVYRILIDRLKKAGSLDVPITEPMSMDWRTESEPSGKQLEDIADQPGWVPRVGEIVLFVRKLEPDETIAYYHQTDSYRVFGSSEQKTYRPTWEAGVITQPSMEKLGIDDLTTETRHDYQVNYSGFRVEPLPDSNSKDKTLSLQHKYIPLSHIRPFIFWRQFLRNIDEKRWHPTILNAVKVISSLSLRNRYHFSGSWPTATISCKGIYIGSELLIPGDMVRITPKSDHDDVTDILRITSIKVRMHRLDQASDNDNDDRHPYNLSVHVAGKAYTTDASKAHDESEAVDLAEYKLEEFAGYSSQWYLRHAPNKKLEVPFFRIMGRCYEDEPMATWLSEQSATHLGEGLSGLLEARAYSEKHDKRILEGKSWFWGEDRAESLGLETLNGQEVSRFDESRDPKRWRKEIRVLEGVADEKERQALKDQSMSHRPLRGYEAGNSMVGAAMQIESSEAPSVADEEEGRSGRSSRKRSRSIAESGNGRLASGRYDGKGDDEEEEDEQAAVNDFIDELAEGIALPMDDEMMDRDDDSEPG